MKAFQFEGQHDTEESDDQESECQHIYNVEGTYGRLPQDDQRTNDGEDAESHVPSPLTGAITLQVHRIACGRETAEHHPEGDYERYDFHAEQRIGYQVDASRSDR